MSDGTPEGRIQRRNDGDLNTQGRYVLYWMTSQRRVRHNFAFQRACEVAAELGVGVVVLEALRANYPWASHRMHRFVLDGMVDNLERLRGRSGVTYHPFVESEADEGGGLLETLAGEATLVVADDYPTFFLPRMIAAAARRLDVRLEAVDSNGLLPMRETPKVYPTAYTFRRYVQKHLPRHLRDRPLADPLEELSNVEAPEIAPRILERWPSAAEALDAGGPDLSELPLDHSIPPTGIRGGARAAERQTETFLAERLPRYAEDRNQPGEDVTSGLSPYLHFGHISVHEVFQRLADREDWVPGSGDREADGKRSGWWGMSDPAEGFLDELITWRELGFNMAALREDHREYDALPDWAKETLGEHADDERPYLYDLATLDGADTHDEVWNAAQRQLRREGVIHNYLRMLWGKKILEWSESPRAAADHMIELNNRYALDGRDPNSYSGIYWCLGRYDRPWGPERPIFGKIRYMSSENTVKKLRMADYLERYGA